MAWLAIACSALVQGLLLWLGIRRPPLPQPWRRLALVTAIAAVLLAAWTIDRPALATLLPWPGLPWWGNLVPIATALAVVAARGEGRRLRWALLAMLLLADLWLLWPLLTAAPVAGPGRIEAGVVLQTTERSCGPAAAANLLRLHGVSCDETEMSRLCRTTRSGTSDWGIVDGLRQRAGGKLVIFLRIAADDLRPELLPAIVSVRLTAAVQAREPRYAERWGWLPGVRHSIVVEAVEDGRVRVIDPAVGRETWDRQALRDLWDGTVISLR